jgi:dolichol-phosphate mannosyltransferase
VVTPVYGCACVLEELTERLLAQAALMQVRMEVILVNDGSPDGAWPKIEALARSNSAIIGINLFRNYGQHFAITAGLDHASGDWVAVLDCDLQDPPEELPKLYRAAVEGQFEAVFGRRAHRLDSFPKRCSSWLFHSVISLLSGIRSDPAVANFSVISGFVVNAIRTLRERHRSYRHLVTVIGPKTAYVDIAHARRPEGRSSYTFWKLLQLASDVIISHTNRPLQIAVVLGFSMSAISVAWMTVLLVRYFVYGFGVAGWASTILTVWLVGGINLGMLGVFGLYLGRVFDQLKARPLYLVKSVIRNGETSSTTQF